MSAVNQPNYNFDNERMVHPDYKQLQADKLKAAWTRIQQEPKSTEPIRTRAYADPEVRKRWLNFLDKSE